MPAALAGADIGWLDAVRQVERRSGKRVALVLKNSFLRRHIAMDSAGLRDVLLLFALLTCFRAKK
jgi:hypothetical protein